VEGVCLATFVETEDWELEDPKGKVLEDVRQVRDDVRSKVVNLIQRMEPSSGQ
jgi:protein-tyrosine-phosphatase